MSVLWLVVGVLGAVVGLIGLGIRLCEPLVEEE